MLQSSPVNIYFFLTMIGSIIIIAPGRYNFATTYMYFSFIFSSFESSSDLSEKLTNI